MYGLETIIALNDRAETASKTADSPVTKPVANRADFNEPKEYKRRMLYPFCNE